MGENEFRELLDALRFAKNDMRINRQQRPRVRVMIDKEYIVLRCGFDISKSVHNYSSSGPAAARAEGNDTTVYNAEISGEN